MMKIRHARGTHTDVRILRDISAEGYVYQVTIPNGREDEFIELEFREYEYDAFISKLVESRRVK